jgi:DNA-binding transcriptional ArsR family regulator
MTEKFIELNLNDEKSSKIAEIISNKTAKKMLSILAEEELSEGDLAKRLGLAANTANYNIKKLMDSGLIEKTSSFFWSVKGKKIPTYRLANKKIIISTKNSFKGLILSSAICGFIFGAIKIGMNFFSNKSVISSASSLKDNLAYETEVAPLMTRASENASFIQVSSIWSNVFVYVLAGLAVGGFFYLIYKKMKGGRNKI